MRRLYSGWVVRNDTDRTERESGRRGHAGLRPDVRAGSRLAVAESECTHDSTDTCTHGEVNTEADVDSVEPADRIANGRADGFSFSSVSHLTVAYDDDAGSPALSPSSPLTLSPNAARSPSTLSHHPPYHVAHSRPPSPRPPLRLSAPLFVNDGLGVEARLD